MKQFNAFVIKEFYHIFRDVRTMMILLGIPLIQIILFGFAITTEVKNSKIAVFDPSKDIATNRIINQLDVSEYFDVDKYITSHAEIEDIFKKGEIKLVVIFGERFNENLMHTGKQQIQLVLDGTDPNTATIVSNYASAIISKYQLELLNDKQIPYQIIPEIKLLYNPQMKGSYNFVPGVLGMIMMLICAMMTSIAIVREKELGTMEVLLVSPMKPLYIILSKTVPYFIISTINLTTVLLLSVFVLDIPIAGSLLLLVSISLIFIFVSLSFGILISTFTNSQLAAMLISGMMFMMPVVVLSGMMFPIENMPKILQIISNVIPARWYIAAVKKIMIKGADITTVIKELIILSSMGIIIITLSLKKFKYRLD